MSFKITFLKRARLEIADITEWYEEKQHGLGLRFLKTLYAQVDKILMNPMAYSEKRKNYREVKLSEFPYLIVYKIQEKKNSIIIVSVFHTSRSTRSKYQG